MQKDDVPVGVPRRMDDLQVIRCSWEVPGLLTL